MNRSRLALFPASTWPARDTGNAPTIAMIPRLKADLGWQELRAALSFAPADSVARFERAFAELTGQAHAIAFPYGRTALAFLLRALELQDAEIICPAYTCVVVPHAIRFSGNEPVFVDSAAGDFNMDLALAEEAVTGRTRALIATSIFGYPVDLVALERFRHRYPNITIIQDCAHGFTSSYHGTPVLQHGTAAIFGLNASKLMTSVFGGMATTDDTELATKLRQMRDREIEAPMLKKSIARRLYLLALFPAFNETVYGAVNRLERAGLLNRFVRYYDEGRIDMPADWLCGMTKFEAHVGQLQTHKYPAIIERRLRNARHYLANLPAASDATVPAWVEGSTYSHFVVLTTRRLPRMKHALEHGVQLGQIIEYCIPQFPAYQDCRYLDRGISTRYAEQALNLPLHPPSITTLDRVIEVYGRFPN
ncbi:hypothetical protein CWR61_00640 [Bordetella bronchiseptica]|nr:hypothetical protein CWR61_00640 [Bordetella bronchiseptica]